MQPSLSVFKNALANQPFEEQADVVRLVGRIRSEKYKTQTDYLRWLNPEAAKEYKKLNFIAVTWSGTFTPTRSKANLTAHSGLICIDLDKLTPDRLKVLHAKLRTDEFTHVLFVSPSGNGLKCVVRIDCRQTADHERFFHQLAGYYRDMYGVTNTELDASGKNVDRLCFLPHDPAIYYNPDCLLMPLFEEYAREPVTSTPVNTRPKIQAVESDARLLDRCTKLIDDAPDGSKHVALCKAATLAGGFIAGGLVSEAEAIQALEDAIRSKPNVASFADAQRTIKTLIEYGKHTPIYEAPISQTSTQAQPVPPPLKELPLSEWPTPTPLKKELMPVLPMEATMLPAALSPWLADIAHRLKCPLDYTAAAAVVMLSSMIGTRLSIKPKKLDDWAIVPNLWGAVIGDPSALKTPSVAEVFKPLNRLITESRESHEAELQRYNAEQATYEAQKKVYQAQEQDRLKGKPVANPVAYPEAVQKPVERRYMTSDATVEKLGELLNENPNGLLQFRDELTGLLAGWDRTGHEQDRAFYLEAWNGNGSCTIDRIGRGTMHVKSVCVSLFGGIQPAKLLGYLHAATGYDNDGFVQRLQVAVYPDRPQWDYTDEVPDKAGRDKAFSLIRQLADMDLSSLGFAADEYNKFPYVHFDNEAQAIFRTWLTELELTVLRAESGLLLEHFTKYRSLMPSLALVFHVVNCIDDPAINRQSVSAGAAQMAVQWCAYLMSHARRIYGLLDTVSLAGAERILAEIKRGKLPDGFKVRDVVQRGWTHLKTTPDVEAALCELVATGWLIEEIADPTGGRPEAPRYRTHPTLSNQNA